MRLGIPYRILVFFSLVVFSGNVDAHPHELGNIDHGLSLESYQTDPDFTTGDSSKHWHDPNITIAKKDKTREGAKNDKNVLSEKSDKTKKVKKAPTITNKIESTKVNGRIF